MAAAGSLGSGWLGFVASTNCVTHSHISSSRGSINTRSCSNSRTCLLPDTWWRRQLYTQVDNNSGSPWLSTSGLARSAAIDSVVGGAEQQPAVDELWWEEGAPVQSLEIACRCVCQLYCCFAVVCVYTYCCI